MNTVFLLWKMEGTRKTIQHGNSGELKLRIIKETLVIGQNYNSYRALPLYEVATEIL